MTESTNPTPGSDEAIAQGCTCPVLDNAHGQGLGDGLFWVNQDCPIHGDTLYVTRDGIHRDAPEM